MLAYALGRVGTPWAVTMRRVDTPLAKNSGLECALRFVLRCVSPTTVVVSRRTGIVPAARALGDWCGLKGDAELNPLTTAVRLSRILGLLN